MDTAPSPDSPDSPDDSPGPFLDAALLTPRLRLRPFTDTEGDLDLLVALDNDEGVKRFIDGGKPLAREAARRDVLPRVLGRGFRAAEERSTGEWLGWFCLEPLSGSGWETVELGYRLRRTAWGRGYATEGARALVATAFGTLGTQRVVGRTMTVNTGSRRVLEKAGLRYVRTFFEEWPETIEGSEHGDVEYAVSREEWGRLSVS
ncbi:GNAT family N-acetyltransferase [Streptomyces sp. 150FB]|uniref:GNAT family N-acetyltransferase n=1 Tax=Streptomyces sp. 150FB TaxID=1576605 RepID=UPI00099C0707|nr:GNAT family N-acetyltransferase [Streptomyces sp. 150FB]